MKLVTKVRTSVLAWFSTITHYHPYHAPISPSFEA